MLWVEIDHQCNNTMETSELIKIPYSNNLQISHLDHLLTTLRWTAYLIGEMASILPECLVKKETQIEEIMIDQSTISQSLLEQLKQICTKTQ